MDIVFSVGGTNQTQARILEGVHVKKTVFENTHNVPHVTVHVLRFPCTLINVVNTVHQYFDIYTVKIKCEKVLNICLKLGPNSVVVGHLNLDFLVNVGLM